MGSRARWRLRGNAKLTPQNGGLLDARSAELYEQAKGLIPGGVNSPVRAMRSIGRDPIFIESGDGCHLVDVDGNRYVDWVGSWGPMILGHAEPSVIKGINDAASSGTSFGAATEREVEIAAEICERFESVEMVRLVNSGTEAAMSAIRLARAATGRDPIIKFAGAYHGHADGLLADAGSGLATQGIPASPGVTAAQAADTIVVPWNDLEALNEAIERDPAAIVAEPLPANMGLVPPEPGFLPALRALADSSGALLIFDEVISGFRVARGGAQELFGLKADLTIMGKVIGGGLPVGAYGGRRELMEMVAPAGEVYQAGTLSGNPLATAAGLATLAKLDQAAYARLDALTDELAMGLAKAAQGRPVSLATAPGLLTLFFRSQAPTDFESASACNMDAHAAFCRAMLSRGVWLPPSQYEAWFVSLAHSSETIASTVAAAAESFAEVFE